jgi:hypothetical protein
MRAVQELVERIKFADPALKKKIILGSVSGVLFLVAGVLLIRAMMGPEAAEADTQTEQAVAELREELASEEPPAPVEDEMPPFQRGGQQEPPQ